MLDSLSSSCVKDVSLSFSLSPKVIFLIIYYTGDKYHKLCIVVKEVAPVFTSTYNIQCIHKHCFARALSKARIQICIFLFSSPTLPTSVWLYSVVLTSSSLILLSAVCHPILNSSVKFLISVTVFLSSRVFI